MASCRSILVSTAFFFACSFSLYHTTLGARTLLVASTAQPAEDSLFKKIPGYGKPKFFKKPPFDPKFKFPQPKSKIPPKIPGKSTTTNAKPVEQSLFKKPIPFLGVHKPFPKVPVVVPKPKSKPDPPKFKVPPKQVKAEEKSAELESNSAATGVTMTTATTPRKTSELVVGDDESKFAHVPGMPKVELPPLLSSPIPYFGAPFVPGLPLKPPATGSTTPAAATTSP